MTDKYSDLQRQYSRISSLGRVSVMGVENGLFDPSEELGFTNEAVEHPKHYNQYKGIEIIDLVSQMDFIGGNIVKYTARHKEKNGKEDLEKALFYLQYAIDNYEELYYK